MARGLLGIEISERAIRYVYLVNDHGKHLIEKAGQILPKADLTSAEAVETEIRRIIKDNGLSPSRIFISVARRDLVIHQVLLPKMSAVEMEEAVSGEIEKIPVFYHRSFDHIYRSIPQEKGKSRVIFAALASSVLDAIVKGVRRTGIPFNHLDITPLNLKEILPRTNPARENEAVLVISDQHTYFGILENRQYKFIYKSSMGIEQFAAAAGSASARDHVIANWTAELKRVLKSYLLDQKKTKLDLLWLIWDKTRVPDLDRRVAADLEVETEVLYLKKIPGLKITDELYMNPIYVLALTPVLLTIHRIKAQFSLNHFFRGTQVRRHIIRAVAVSVIFLILTLGAFVRVMQELQSRKDQLVTQTVRMTTEISTLEQQSQELFRKHAEYTAIRNRLLNQATYVQKLNRISWTQVLSVVAQELPEDMGLKMFRLKEDGSAIIEGDALRMEPVSELLRRVESSATLEQGKFSFLREREIRKQKFFSFGIFARLKAMEENQK